MSCQEIAFRALGWGEINKKAEKNFKNRKTFFPFRLFIRSLAKKSI